MNFYGVTEKVKSDKGSAFTTREVKLFCENWIIEINYSSPRLHTGTGAVERAMQTLKNLNNANLDRTNRKHKPSIESNAFYDTYRT